MNLISLRNTLHHITDAKELLLHSDVEGKLHDMGLI